ncbi:hypothetical protein C8Q74DRAFT_1297542 [Fomes fomentarius]|nr:hypothetical protein C8Q74DRAFT_1297542 [Fomes fomentarius]
MYLYRLPCGYDHALRYRLASRDYIPCKEDTWNAYTHRATRALVQLLSSVNATLSHAWRSQVEAHIPLTHHPYILLRPLHLPVIREVQDQKKFDTHRRRRSRRKAPHAKGRVPPTVATDVEARRRRNTYGASWGWASPSSTTTTSAAASDKLERESWRRESLSRPGFMCPILTCGDLRRQIDGHWMTERL